jgi:DNA-binding NtrC family response regulator
MSVLVLVLGKDALTREGILYNLEFCGYHAVGFEDGLHALRALSGIKFNVLIISASHTYPSGHELLRQAKKLQPNLRTVLIDKAPPDEAAIPYVDAFVQRPFGMSSVHDALKQVLCHQQQSMPLQAWTGRLQSSAIH